MAVALQVVGPVELEEDPVHIVTLDAVFFYVVALEVPVMEIRDLVVDTDNRGRGVGRALLEHAFAWGIKRRMRGATLEVAEANTPALRLYKAHGMYPTGRTLVRDLVERDNPRSA
jgi:ribosomal protein S18 acetylase RimI-like enzyme